MYLIVHDVMFAFLFCIYQYLHTQWRPNPGWSSPECLGNEYAVILGSASYSSPFTPPKRAVAALW
jgi:hypothetical protein